SPPAFTPTRVMYLFGSIAFPSRNSARAGNFKQSFSRRELISLHVTNDRNRPLGPVRWRKDFFQKSERKAACDSGEMSCANSFIWCASLIADEGVAASTRPGLVMSGPREDCPELLSPLFLFPLRNSINLREASTQNPGWVLLFRVASTEPNF